MEESQQDFAELYDEMQELDLKVCQKMSRGLTTLADAIYIAGRLGLVTEFRKELSKEL